MGAVFDLEHQIAVVEQVVVLEAGLYLIGPPANLARLGKGLVDDVWGLVRSALAAGFDGVADHARARRMCSSRDETPKPHHLATHHFREKNSTNSTCYPS